MKSQFIYMNNSEIDKPIYKVLKFDYLIDMLENNRNTLINPSEWQELDPFENLFLNSKIEFKSGITLQSELGKSVFCQSWSYTKESDAIWRIYSPDKNSVKISSTPRKLFNSLFSIENNINKVFIGKVKYLKSIDLKKLYHDNSKKWVLEENGIGNCKTLLYKRYPFKHENEVRLVYNTFENFNETLLKYEINPNEIIDNVVFDPRINYSDFKARKNIIKDLGYNKSIIKSNLYKLPIYNTIK
jgi:hypothetical protein